MSIEITRQHRTFLFISFILLGLAVVLGAFGAHMLESRLSVKYMATYKTANLYHYIHALGMAISTIALAAVRSSRVSLINLFFLIGLLCFSVALYVLSFNEYLDLPQLKILGAVAPIGGIAFIIAWLMTALEIRPR